MQSLNDSIQTSVSIGLFVNLEESIYYHSFHTEFVMIDMAEVINFNNFNPNRLQKTACDAYPDKPRGDNDILSVEFHCNKIITNSLEPIWIAKKDNQYTLLDGAHRIVASHISQQQTIPCYCIWLLSEAEANINKNVIY